MQFTHGKKLYCVYVWAKGEQHCVYVLCVISLLLLILSVGYYIAQVFVVQVPGNIQGEVGKHLVHLEKITQDQVRFLVVLVEFSQK